MDKYAGRLLADRYRLPQTPSDEFEFVESRAFDTASGQEVLVRQVPLPEVVEAELVDGAGRRGGPAGAAHGAGADRATRTPDDPVVRRAVEAATAAAGLPDHPRLDQVFDVFVQGDGLWIVSELVPARSLAALLAEERLGPYRAAEVAADLLAALRIVHAHGWTHRNVTARTVLICEDGRAVLTGLAAGAAEEVLCGYDPLPAPEIPDTFAAHPRKGVTATGPADRGPADPGPVGRVAFGKPGPAGGRPPAGNGGSAGGTSSASPAPGVPGGPGGPAGGGGWPPDGGDGGALGGGSLPAHGPGAASGGPGAAGGWPPGGGGAGLDDDNGGALGGGSVSLPAQRGPGGGGSGGWPPGDGGASGGPGAAGGWPPDGGDAGFGNGGAAGGTSGAGTGTGTGTGAWPPDGGGPAYDEGVPGGGPSGPRGAYGPDGGEGRAGPGIGAPTGAGYWGSGEPQWPAGFTRDQPPADTDESAGGPGEPAELPPGFQDGEPGSELPDGYRRWDSGQRPRPGGGELAARMRQQGGRPEDRDGLPSTWDFEGGAEGRGGADESTGEHRQPGAPGERPTTDRAARSGAIAAYRAGARAGAARSANMSPRPPGADGANGASPTDLPGARRPSEPVRTGWELTEPPRPRPQGPQPGGAAQDPTAGAPTAGAPRPGARSQDPGTGPQEPTGRGPVALPPGAARPPGAPQLPGAPQHSGHPGGPQRGGGEAREPVPVGAGVHAGAEQRYRGPDSALAAERARQARITTVGAVTERWAPEQAGPVYEHWRLAPPVGPPADFWALGALLFRAVQGYPAYPEDSAAELVQAVCAEPPAFAEDCGALRPIVDSLLRQDPTERPSAEALRGWLRSLLRGAPEPDVGRRTVTAPPPALEPGRPSDPRRLPILRRRGELVGPRRRPRGERRPRRLGRVLLTLVLLGLAGAVAYVLAFAPGERSGGDAAGENNPPDVDTPPDDAENPDQPGDSDGAEGDDENEAEGGDATEPTEGATQPSPNEEDSQPAPPPEGFELVDDAAGFALAVPEGWQREEGEQGRIVYTDGEVRLLVVPGRDSVSDFGDTPMDYQLTEQPELADFRAYQFSSQSGLIETRVGDVQMAEGVFGWRDGDQELVAYNRVLLIAGDYHVVQVLGPADRRDRVADIYDVTAESYRRAG